MDNLVYINCPYVCSTRTPGATTGVGDAWVAAGAVPRAPLLRHQAALRHMEGLDLVLRHGDRACITTSGGELSVYSAGVWGRGCVATHRRTLISVVVLRHRPPRGRLRWSLSRLISGGYTRAPLSFRWAPWDPAGYTRAGPSRGGCPSYL
jgi:hypothetical protein